MTSDELMRLSGYNFYRLYDALNRATIKRGTISVVDKSLLIKILESEHES